MKTLNKSNLGDIKRTEMKNFKIIYFYDSFYLFGKKIKLNKIYDEKTIKNFIEYLELKQILKNIKRYKLIVLTKNKQILNVFYFDNLENLNQKSKEFENFNKIDNLEYLNTIQNQINEILNNLNEIPIILT